MLKHLEEEREGATWIVGERGRMYHAKDIQNKGSEVGHAWCVLGAVRRPVKGEIRKAVIRLKKRVLQCIKGF